MTTRRQCDPQQLLAPEVIAGQKMDLNRPFGDGRDNTDRVVTNPKNGERRLKPWPKPAIRSSTSTATASTTHRVESTLTGALHDSNNNGQYDTATPTPIATGQRHDGTRDIGFDYTNGHGEPLYAPIRYTTAGYGPNAGVRNLESESRQLFARQLYCLMLLLVDENYVRTDRQQRSAIVRQLDQPIPQV